MRNQYIARNCEIVKTYLENESFSETGRSYELPRQSVATIVRWFAITISGQIRTGESRRLSGLSAVSYSVEPSTHPFTPDKYPHLYEGKDGVVKFKYLKPRDLLAEREFTLQRLEVIKKRALGAKEYAYHQIRDYS